MYAAADLLPTAMAYKQFPIKGKKLILILDKRPFCYIIEFNVNYDLSDINCVCNMVNHKYDNIL